MRFIRPIKADYRVMYVQGPDTARLRRVPQRRSDVTGL
jgi:hypothetical protein